MYDNNRLKHCSYMQPVWGKLNCRVFVSFLIKEYIGTINRSAIRNLSIEII